MLTEIEKKEIGDGFKAAGSRMDDLDSSMFETAAEIKALKQQLANYRHLLNSKDGLDEPRNRFWRDDEQAKEFGHLILKALGRKALDSTTNIGGGVLVSDELSRRLIDKIAKYGKFRNNATIVPLGNSTQSVPKIETDLVVYCPGQGNEIDESDMEFGQISLIPKTLACLAKVSNELDEDSIIGIGEILGISIARSMAKKEDEIGFMGDGTSTYFGMRGIIGALRAVNTTIANIKGLVVASGNAYSEIVLGDFRKVVGILPPELDDTSKWYMSKKFYFDVIYPLAETAGVANIFEILSDRKAKYFLGYEVEFVSCMPSTAANSQICALLGDLQVGAYLGQRKGLTIEQSKDVYFANNQLGIRGIERVDINAFGVGDTTDPGAIVGLIMAAA